MLKPKIIAVNETVTLAASLATVTLQVELADLDLLIAGCDTSEIEGSAQLVHALDSAAALRKIREVEEAAIAAAEPAPPLPPAPPAPPKAEV